MGLFEDLRRSDEQNPEALLGIQEAREEIERLRAGGLVQNPAPPTISVAVHVGTATTASTMMFASTFSTNQFAIDTVLFSAGSAQPPTSNAVVMEMVPGA